MNIRLLSTLLFLVCVLPATARATSREDKRAAATAFAKGKRLLQQNKADDAVAALEEAVNLDPSGKHRIEYAKALVAQGSLEEALGALSGIDEDDDKTAAKAGAKLQKDLAARVPALTITLSNDVPGVVVMVGEREVNVGEATRLNPGMHVVRIEQDGETKEERSVVLRERDKRKLVMGAKLSATPATTESAQDSEADPDSGKRGTWWPAALGYGAGGAGVILGSTFGFLAFQTTNDVEIMCNAGRCPEETSVMIDQSKVYGNVSTGLFVTSVLALGAGVVFTFTHGLSSEEVEKPAVAVRTSFGPGSAALALDF
jgi:hypothetical protein